MLEWPIRRAWRARVAFGDRGFESHPLRQSWKTSIATALSTQGRIEPKTPDIFNVLTQSIHAMECELSKLAAKSADIIITPDVSHIGTFGFHRGEEAISQGYKATQTILPELQEKFVVPS